MGVVASRADEGGPFYLRDQNRLAVTNVKITTSRNRILYLVQPNSFPATRFVAKRDAEDDGVAEFVQDPDNPSTGGIPNFLLRINNDEEVVFNFTFQMRQSSPTTAKASEEGANATAAAAVDAVINSLTFIFASTPKDLDTIITREFHANPNLHRNPNVDLVGDYSTAGNPLETFEWSWKWRPPKPAEDKGGGWRNTCSFVEYDQRTHRLNTLVTFSFWIHNTQRLFYNPSSPKSISPRTMDLVIPPDGRARIPSTQSIDTRMSDSDTDLKDTKEAPSPVEMIPETGIPALENATTNASASTALSAASPVKVDLNYQRTGEDMSAVDDGPVFRATMKSLEQKTGTMRIRMKKVLKKAEAAREAQVISNQSIAAFMEALREASTSNANAVQPAIEHYFEKIAKEILGYEEQNVKHLQRLIIDPINKLYSNDIKQAESKKKDFEDESRDYYAYVSRYLGQRQDSLKEKKRAESDSKYQVKRKNFELKRFDYSSFMQDLHGGRKDQEVLSQLTKYADAQARGYLATAQKIETMLPQLEALIAEVNEADKEYQLIRTGREEKRRALEKSEKPYVEPESAAPMSQSVPSNTPVNSTASRTGMLAESDALGSANGVTPGLGTERPKSAVALSATASNLPTDPATLSSSPSAQRFSTSMSPGQNKFKGYRDLEEQDYPARVSSLNKESGHRKEGLLWSLSRPGSHADPRGLNKQAWHKFWIVLDQGKLSEYINWKQNLEPHMDPIDLRVASVREARNAERRFCFEVITPHFTRVYQATGEDDMRNWIRAINNALQSAFETRSSEPTPVSPVQTSGSIGRDIFGKSSSYHGHRSSSNSSTLAAKNVSRHATVGDRPPLSRSRSEEERPARLLQQIREVDAGNAWCADCNSDIRVEWVSINLGIIICIECSGIHRSLGTHITKMRSLTLDTSTFTQDLVELLLTVGNRVSNMIWEAKLDRSQKPGPQATRDQRLKFITAKYADKAYIEPLSAGGSHFSKPDETLLASIKKQDIQGVLHALALSANPNSADRSRSTHAVYLALAAADPAMPPSPNPETSKASASTSAPDERKSFPMAELLLQNGADIPAQPAPIPLSKSALAYIEFKQSQKLGRATSNTSSTSGTTVIASQITNGSSANITPSSTGAPLEGDRLTALPSFGNSAISAGTSPSGGSEKRDPSKLIKRASSGGASMANKLAKSAGMSSS